MTTNFTLTLEGKMHELQARRICTTDVLERWVICSRGDEIRFLVVTNDRPCKQSIHQYRASYKWTIEESDPAFRKMVSQITSFLEYYIKGLWKMPKKEGAVAFLNQSLQPKLF